VLFSVVGATEAPQCDGKQIVIIYSTWPRITHSFNYSIRIQELSQIEPLPPLPVDSELRQESLTEMVLETFSPISPNADRSVIKALGNCEQEARLTVSHEHNSVMWDLAEFAKAGKLLNNKPMPVEFHDEYEMRKVYSLIYDVFRCK